MYLCSCYDFSEPRAIIVVHVVLNRLEIIALYAGSVPVAGGNYAYTPWSFALGTLGLYTGRTAPNGGNRRGNWSHAWREH